MELSRLIYNLSLWRDCSNFQYMVKLSMFNYIWRSLDFKFSKIANTMTRLSIVGSDQLV